MHTFRKTTVVALVILWATLFSCVQKGPQNQTLPQGFVYANENIPDARLDVRYYTHDNFLGVPVDGYLAPKVILSNEAALALEAVADELHQLGYGLILFDGYRPQKAVNHFVRWAEDINDTLSKQKYYPDVDKSLLFELGYIASRSGHSRGSTIDLTLYYLESGQEVDMGSGFDFFGPISNHGTGLITPEQTANREILLGAMLRQGFRLYEKEWWHYTLDNEPYPDTYFDFDIQ